MDVRTQQHLEGLKRAMDKVVAAHGAGASHQMFLALMAVEDRARAAQEHLNELYVEQQRRKT